MRIEEDEYGNKFLVIETDEDLEKLKNDVLEAIRRKKNKNIKQST